MKICILTHTFPRFEKDTAAPFMDGLASGLADVGNSVWVLTPYHPKFPALLKRKPYKVVTYKYIWPRIFHKLGYSETLTDDKKLKLLVYFIAPLMILFGALALLRLVKKEKIDIVNAHWILPNGFLGTLVSKLTGVPVVSTLPGSDVYLAGKNKLFSWMARFAASSEAITSNSPQLLEDLRKIVGASVKDWRGKCRAIIYGVDPQKFKPDITQTLRLKKSLGIPQDDIVVLGVGRLVDKKGFRYLIEAAALVLKETPKVSFVIVGSGDKEKELKDLTRKLGVDNKFYFTGAVVYENLAHYYNLADIFVLPSVRDEKGNLDDQSVVVVEAMACGKPVVTTDFPGYRIVVQNGGNGVLVNEKDASSIRRALIKLISSPLLRKSMGERSRVLAQLKFSWRAIGKDYTQLFHSVLERSRFYSQGVPKILDRKERLRVAKQIIGVLKVHLGQTGNLSCLDVGCSNGIITRELANHFNKAVGVDVDKDAISWAKKNLKKNNLQFYKMSVQDLKWPDNSFNVVVCNQVYNFVDNPQKLIKEIHRVLKPGGVCFFAARNKYAIIEPQYNLPFLSWLPSSITGFIVRLTGKGNYYFGRNYLSYWGLKKLVSILKVHDYTLKILENPGKFGFLKLTKYGIIGKFMPELFLLAVPNYIWILEKRV